MIGKFKTMLLLSFIGSIVAQPSMAEQNAAKDVAALKVVVEKYRSAIINKDVNTFTNLFFSANPAEVTWQFVADDTRVERLKKKSPMP